MELMKLTGRESGVVLWKDEEGLVCDQRVENWSGIDGLPRYLFGTLGPIGLHDGDDLKSSTLTNIERDLAVALARVDGDYDPKIEGVWRNREAVVVTFEGWN